MTGICRPRGGRASPRYYYLKENAENRLCNLLEQDSVYPTTQQWIDALNAIALHVDHFIAGIRSRS